MWRSFGRMRVYYSSVFIASCLALNVQKFTYTVICWFRCGHSFIRLCEILGVLVLKDDCPLASRFKALLLLAAAVITVGRLRDKRQNFVARVGLLERVRAHIEFYGC
jgi:hypothetical protein